MAGPPAVGRHHPGSNPGGASIHADTDEAFLVIDGTLTVYFRDGSVNISGGELFVVPRGVEHKTFAGRECTAMLVERAGTINTGDVVSDLTAEDDVWI